MKSEQVRMNIIQKITICAGLVALFFVTARKAKEPETVSEYKPYAITASLPGMDQEIVYDHCHKCGIGVYIDDRCTHCGRGK